MSILLSDTKDQALITMVIQEAQQFIEKSHTGYLGRTALQKILYFLKVLGVPMNYSFNIHHHGPFCVDILNDVDLLIADGIIKDDAANINKYSDYKTSENLNGILEKFSDIEKFRKNVRIVVNAMLPLTPDQLELIATLDFAYRWERASGGSGPWKQRVIKKFFEIKMNKKSKFDPNDPKKIEKAYDSLVKAKLIEA